MFVLVMVISGIICLSGCMSGLRTVFTCLDKWGRAWIILKLVEAISCFKSWILS